HRARDRVPQGRLPAPVHAGHQPVRRRPLSPEDPRPHRHRRGPQGRPGADRLGLWAGSGHQGAGQRRLRRGSPLPSPVHAQGCLRALLGD
ncbi:hypothetical protein LTR94_036928, partial [Friedmanniomyces endolithicus]